MRPFGFITRIKHFAAKRDFHCHSKNRKVAPWWEDYSNPTSRRKMKQDLNREMF